MIPKIHSLLHYIECFGETGSPSNNDTEISGVFHMNFILDHYHSFNMGHYIWQIIQLEMPLFHLKLWVSILLHIVKWDPISWKADICRKHLVEDSPASDKLSPRLIPRITGVMSESSAIATLSFPEGIGISVLIDPLTSYCSPIQVDMGTSIDLRTTESCVCSILR